MPFAGGAFPDVRTVMEPTVGWLVPVEVVARGSRWWVNPVL
jgi:hypothetical protein